MKNLGLDVPQVTELVYRLREKGYDLPQDIITEEECVKALAGLFDNSKGKNNGE